MCGEGGQAHPSFVIQCNGNVPIYRERERGRDLVATNPLIMRVVFQGHSVYICYDRFVCVVFFVAVLSVSGFGHP